MRKIYFTLLSIGTVAFCNAQNNMNFEPGGYGTNYAWNVFENDTNPPLEFVANPNPSGPNTSGNVAKFKVLSTGQPWAGCETQQPGNNPWEGGPGMGNWTLNADNAIIKIMIYKKSVGDVGIKLVMPNDDARPEKKVSNTTINQWEELTFDFTDVIDHPNMPAGNVYNQIVIFPDFQSREDDFDVYFDNIVFGTQTMSAGKPAELKISMFPNPVKDVLSLNCKGTIESIALYNMLGQEVGKTAPGANTAQVNVSNLQKGVYIANIVVNGQLTSQRFIKE